MCLRHGLRLQSIKRCDQFFLTCYALHNRFLVVDRLDNNWSTGAEHNWVKEHNNHKRQSSSFTIKRLHLNQDEEEGLSNSELVTSDKRIC